MYTPSLDDSRVVWSYLQYGLPTLVFLLLGLWSLEQFHYRWWRLQMWTHQLSHRWRIQKKKEKGVLEGMEVDKHGFDALGHFHDRRQEAARVRLALAPLLVFGVILLLVLPFSILIAWAATLYFNLGNLLLALAVVLMGVCICSLYYAVQYWRSGGWRMTSHILRLFVFSLCCYFLLAFVLSFLSPGVSFFGQSVHFLTLNYLLLTELVSQLERHQQIPARMILKADQYISGGAPGAPVGLIQGERLSKEEKAKLQREQERKFFAKVKEQSLEGEVVPQGVLDGTEVSVRPVGADLSVDSDDEIPSDDEEALLAKEDKAAAALINIDSSRGVSQFKDVLHAVLHESRESHAHRDRVYQIKLYLLSLGVLLGYALMIYYYEDAPLPSADSGGGFAGSSRYLGFIVSGILVIWDLLVFSYAAHCGHPIEELTQMLVMGGSRVALISFGFQGWFLGVCCLYGAAGAYLGFRAVDRRLPFQAFQLDLGKRECQRFSEFCRTTTHPDDEHASAASTSSSNSLLRTMSRKSSGIGIAEFVLIVLTVLFMMALTVSYTTSPPPQSMGSLSDEPWQQWEFGLAVWCGVTLWLLSVWCIRYWMTTMWKLTWKSVVITALTQVCFSVAGMLIYLRTSSVIFLVWMVCGPFFVLALLGTYMHCVSVDWRLFRPSHMRNPPNAPFWLAVLGCGLQRDDYRMMFNLLFSSLMLVVIGLAITLGLDGSSIGWSLTFILFILLTSLIPLIKYLKTLTLTKLDVTLLLMSLAAHIAFFSLMHYTHQDTLTDKQRFGLWGSCVAYPTLLANVLAYNLFTENGRKLSKNTAMIFLFSVVLLVIVVFISFFTLGNEVGGMILAAVLVVLGVTALVIRWVHGHFTLPKPLRWVAGTALAALLVAGVALGVALPEDESGFWAYSGSWFLIILYVAVMAYGDKARLNGGTSRDASAHFRYSDFIFPVYYFDRRNESNPVRGANLHMGLYCLCFLLFFCWCVACMVTERVNIGLGCSALCLVAFYTFARHKSISANKALMKTVQYLNEDIVRKSKETSRDTQLSGSSLLFSAPEPSVIGIKRWGELVSEMLLLNIDPLPMLKRKQNALKKKLGLGRACFCARLRTSALQLDDHLILLDTLNDWSAMVSTISFKIEAHFYFLLMSNAVAARKADQSTMKAFVAWLKKEKRTPPPAMQPIDIDPYVTNDEIYESPYPHLRYSTAKILQIQRWKEEYIESLAVTQQENETNRRKEAEAELVRERRLAEREKQQEERAKVRQEERRAKKEQEALAEGKAPAEATALAQAQLEEDEELDPVELEFREIVAEFRRTGKQWEDPDFPADDTSLYLDGERDPTKGSAVNMTRIDCWMRPGEILKKLAEENPDQQISTQPRLFLDGFDLQDIEQGNIGSCYFLSAIGCLGLRELAAPHTKLLSDIFTMESPDAEYNTCGAFVVRFYRAGQERKVLIDDRLPVHNGSYAFSRCREKDELWVALIEKAYAKLFTCYEAIEAGLISQALCDLSNGASEQIALKGADGQICVQEESLWTQLEDSFNSGYLIGAGSNTGSDTTMVNGIAQGHAYMVVRIFTDAKQSEKLIQLQNPHGHGEWDGDWSDNSDKWTQWWMNTLRPGEQEGSDTDDGKFWMSFQDFLQSYQNIYICRLLPHRQSIRSAWKGHTAAGVAKPYHNPTFVVTSPTACKVWVELEQDNKRGRLKPLASETGVSELDLSEQPQSTSDEYAFIMFCVLDNGGNRVEKLSKDSVKLAANKWKMVNDRQIGAELFLDSPDTPYTIICLTKQAGCETGLTLSVFSQDNSVQLTMLPDEPPPQEEEE